MYGIWGGMLKRCYNPNCGDYHRYGGRGIGVCRRWRHDFSAFLHDMGPRPSPAHSLDRKKVNKGYSPTNFRRATRQQQADNKASTKKSLIKARRRRCALGGCSLELHLTRCGRASKSSGPQRVCSASLRAFVVNTIQALKLTDRVVRDICRSSASSILLSRRYGVTARHIRKLRAGSRRGTTHAR